MALQESEGMFPRERRSKRAEDKREGSKSHGHGEDSRDSGWQDDLDEKAMLTPLESAEDIPRLVMDDEIAPPAKALRFASKYKGVYINGQPEALAVGPNYTNDP